MILLHVHVDEYGSVQRAGQAIIILDHVYAIEFNKENNSLDFWVAGSRNPTHFFVSDAATEQLIMTKLMVALSPLYEGRIAQVVAVKITLDLRNV